LQSPCVFGVWVCAEDFGVGGVERVFFVERGGVDDAVGGGVGVGEGGKGRWGACGELCLWSTG
jgi:hypothetical protein